MISFICVLLLATGHVVTASQAVTDLARELHEPVKISWALKDDLVFIEPAQALPKALITSLATALHASVRRAESGLVIERTPNDLKEIEQGRITERTHWLTERLDSVQRYRATHNVQSSEDYMAALRSRGQDWMQFAGRHIDHPNPFYIGELLPSETVLEGIMERIGLEKLAALPSGEVQVFEDQPQGETESLPEHQDLIDTYINSMTSFTNAKPLSTDRFYARQLGSKDVFDGWDKAALTSKLRLEERSTRSEIYLILEGFDSHGNRSLLADFLAGPAGIKGDSFQTMRAEEKKSDAAWIDLSPEGRAAIQPLQPGSALPAWFIHPDKQEPMDLFVREALQSLASEHPDNAFVVDVSDDLWLAMKLASKDGRINVGALKDQIRERVPYDEVTESGSTVWRLRDPVLDEAARADRKVLARFGQEFQDVHRLDIRSFCRLFHDSAQEISTLAETYFHAALGYENKFPYPKSDLSEEVYWFLGSISDDGWQALSNGSTVTCGQVGAEEGLKRFVRREVRLKGVGSQLSDLLRHPGESLPNGVDATTPLAVKIGSDQMLLATDADRKLPKEWFDVETSIREFANKLEVSWVGEAPVVSTKREVFEQGLSKHQYRLGDRAAYAVKIGLQGGLYAEGSVTGEIVEDTDQMEYADLPQDFRDAMWSEACQLAVNIAIQNRDILSGRVGGPVSAVAQPAKPMP